MVDKSKAVCCLLATSAIMLSEKKKRKRKMCSKKWHLKRNISCNVHMLNGVPWDGAIVVSAGKLWNSLSELRSVLCERRLEMTVLRLALLPVKSAQFTQFFFSSDMSHSEISHFNLTLTTECEGEVVHFIVSLSRVTVTEYTCKIQSFCAVNTCLQLQ